MLQVKGPEAPARRFKLQVTELMPLTHTEIIITHILLLILLQLQRELGGVHSHILLLFAYVETGPRELVFIGWYWDLRGKFIYALLLLIWLGVDPSFMWICYKLDNPRGHHDGEFDDIDGHRRLQEIKCTERKEFGPVSQAVGNIEWHRCRFVGIQLPGPESVPHLLAC
jgi:hypothetical protein